MSHLRALPIIAILLITLITGCNQKSSLGVVQTPTAALTPVSTIPLTDTYPAYPPPSLESTSTPGFRFPLVPTITQTSQPTPTPTLSRLADPLPAPLYLIGPVPGGDSFPQIWRLEKDGSQATQITYEEAGITAFDVSVDGRLAYTSNNILLIADAMGSQRKVIAQGEPLPLGDVNVVDFIQITTPVWSPDGKRIAFGMDQVWVADPESGERIQVTVQRTDIRGNDYTYKPIGWTPDGEKIILEVLPPLYGYGGGISLFGLGFVDPKPGSIPINPGTLSCCEYSIRDDGKVLLGGEGLWVIDPTTGQKISLLPEQDPNKPPHYPSMGWPKQSPNNQIFFFASRGSETKESILLAFVDEKHKPIQYPEDATFFNQMELGWLYEALWSPDASMVLVSYGGVHKIDTLNGSATQLNIVGYHMRWGVQETTKP